MKPVTWGLMHGLRRKRKTTSRIADTLLPTPEENNDDEERRSSQRYSEVKSGVDSRHDKSTVVADLKTLTGLM